MRDPTRASPFCTKAFTRAVPRAMHVQSQRRMLREKSSRGVDKRMMSNAAPPVGLA